MKRMFLIGLLAASLPIALSGQALFTKIANDPSVTFTNTPAAYKGAVWIDLNRDNWPDLFVGQRFLFLNTKKGGFTRLADVNGATGGQGAFGASWGDIDNDGDVDCITASLNSLIHYNNGDNTFKVPTTPSPNEPNWDCALADVDNNGLLDVLFLHAEGFHLPALNNNKFLLQSTKDYFMPVTGFEFTDKRAPYTIPTWTDYDLDGDLDLFIGTGPGNSLGPDYRYKNLLKEKGFFSLQRLTEAPFNQLENGQVYNFIDFDNDGDMDGCLTNYTGVKSRFWRNDQGKLKEIATPFSVNNAYLSNVWGDVDNDGYLDALFSIDQDPNIYLHRNLGNGTFGAAQIAGTGKAGACGVVLADYDNDGDLDFYVNGPSEARALYRNDQLSSGKNWTYFTLEGKESNRSAIGALIRVKASIKGQSMWQIREVLAHNSFQGQSDLRQHFGLSDASDMDSVEVRWPSGKKQFFTNLKANTFYQLTEGEEIKVFSGSVGTSPVDDPERVELFPNPGAGAFFVSIGRRRMEQASHVEAYDLTGRRVSATATAQETGWDVRLPDDAPLGLYYIRAVLRDGRSDVQLYVRKAGND